MRAAYIEATGPPELIRIGDLPTPKPGAGEVLVKVSAAALNPIDLYIRAGTVPMALPFPFVVGSDLCGTVVQLGPSVKRCKVGDRVWGSNQGLLGRQGVTAEYAAVSEEWLYSTPQTLTDPEAAAQALTGITAHLGLFENGRLSAGETVYVPGGAGGVGSMVVQMAKAVGARVATSGGRKESVDVCKKLGADLVLNYKTDDIPARLREFAPEGVDVWYETQREPNLEVSIPLLRRFGRMILIAGRAAKPPLPLGAFYPRNCSIHGFAMFNSPPDVQRRCADDINRWTEAGKLRAVIGRTFPLSETGSAHRFLEENTLGGAGTLSGKVVVTIA
ncbi:MAG TPA: NADPH:quinone reductase [Isosphaeraceae bacterium]|nr:NADPH:quinone reductase [Isosphaeraceae bacterium]